MKMKRLSPKARKILLKIYIGQNIRDEGILQSQIRDEKTVNTLLSEKFIRENHWHIDQFLTTEKGSRLARRIVKKKIEENKDGFREKTREIPPRTLSFFTKRYISRSLAFATQREYFEEQAHYACISYLIT